MINKISDSSLSQISISKDTTFKASTQTNNDIETSESSGVILETGNTADKKVTYDNPSAKKLTSDDIAKLWDQANTATETLRNMVKALLQQQGIAFQDTATGTEDTKVDGQAGTDATNLITADGDFGVKAVSDKIIAFAKSLAGGDSSKIAVLRDAIKKGFSEAAGTLGKSLPDICNKTYDTVMSQLDSWENEGTTETTATAE